MFFRYFSFLSFLFSLSIFYIYFLPVYTILISAEKYKTNHSVFSHFYFYLLFIFKLLLFDNKYSENFGNLFFFFCKFHCSFELSTICAYLNQQSNLKNWKIRWKIKYIRRMNPAGSCDIVWHKWNFIFFLWIDQWSVGRILSSASYADRNPIPTHSIDSLQSRPRRISTSIQFDSRHGSSMTF